MSCRAAGSKDVHYMHDESAKLQDQHAVGAEFAVAKLLDGYPIAIRSVGSDNRGADVRIRNTGSCAYETPGRENTLLQVRHTTFPTGFCPIYPEDKDEQVFVFVVGELPTFVIVGWVRAGDVKVGDYWRRLNPRTGKPLRCPCYVVEQGFMTPFKPRIRFA